MTPQPPDLEQAANDADDRRAAHANRKLDAAIRRIRERRRRERVTEQGEVVEEPVPF
jgi:hypothetical protein